MRMMSNRSIPLNIAPIAMDAHPRGAFPARPSMGMGISNVLNRVLLLSVLQSKVYMLANQNQACKVDRINAIANGRGARSSGIGACDLETRIQRGAWTPHCAC